jgi:hypothetical protein
MQSNSVTIFYDMKLRLQTSVAYEHQMALRMHIGGRNLSTQIILSRARVTIEGI